MLTEKDRVKLDNIVMEMVANKESDTNINLVVNDFKKKYDTPETTQKATKTSLQKVSKTLDSIFGGGKIGEAIGAKIAKSRVPEEQKKYISGPSKKEILGDVAKIGLTVASTAIPVVKGAQLAKAIPKLAGRTGLRSLATLGTNVGIAGGIGAGFGASEALRENKKIGKEAIRSGVATAGITGGLGLAGRAIQTTIPTVYKLLANTLAQTPVKAIERFSKNPQAGKIALKKAVEDPTMIFKIADEAQNAVDEIQRIKTANFKKGLQKLSVGKAKLDKNIIFTKMQKVLESDGLVRGGLNNIPNRLPNPVERNTMIKIIDEINRTPSDIESMLNLKRFLQNQYSGTRSRDFNAIVTRLANTVRDEMPSKVKKLLKQSQADEQLLGQLKKELGISRGTQGLDIASEEGNVVVRENTQKVINALRKTFKEKSDVGPILLAELEKRGGSELIDDIAAQFFKEVIPPSGLQSVLGLGAGSVAAIIGSILNPATLAGTIPTLALAGSPRNVGRIAIKSGQVSKLGEKLKQPIGRTGRTLIGSTVSKKKSK